MELKYIKFLKLSVCIGQVILILTGLSADSKCIYLPLQLLIFNLSLYDHRIILCRKYGMELL
jgi:hypothetical protein